MLTNFLKDGKLIQWPSKKSDRDEAVLFLIKGFEKGNKYSEKNVTLILEGLHTFNDPAFLRRELCNRGILQRDKYGNEYWLS